MCKWQTLGKKFHRISTVLFYARQPSWFKIRSYQKKEQKLQLYGLIKIVKILNVKQKFLTIHFVLRSLNNIAYCYQDVRITRK